MSNVDLFIYRSYEEMLKQLSLIQAAIEAAGFCVIRVWDHSVNTIKQIASLFGTVQLHIRSDKDGVVGGEEPNTKIWEKYKDEYKGVGNDEFHPHADGSFIQGLMVYDRFSVKVKPPKILLLQC